jgi:hypothetical protein
MTEGKPDRWLELSGVLWKPSPATAGISLGRFDSVSSLANSHRKSPSKEIIFPNIRAHSTGLAYHHGEVKVVWPFSMVSPEDLVLWRGDRSPRPVGTHA